MTLHTSTFVSPVGPLVLVADDRALLAVDLPGAPPRPGPESPGHPVLARAAAQLAGYFAGRRRAFDLPLAPAGTPFQQAVWRALAAIPFGETRSYAELARAAGRPRAVRAVGAANGRNPLPVVLPCHRVIGSDGGLTGYAGGLLMKRRLLELEGALAPAVGRRRGLESGVAAARPGEPARRSPDRAGAGRRGARHPVRLD